MSRRSLSSSRKRQNLFKLCDRCDFSRTARGRLVFCFCSCVSLSSSNLFFMRSVTKNVSFLRSSSQKQKKWHTQAAPPPKNKKRRETREIINKINGQRFLFSKRRRPRGKINYFVFEKGEKKKIDDETSFVNRKRPPSLKKTREKKRVEREPREG